MVADSLKPRGPMGWRSTSSHIDMEWEDASTYVPPLVYAIVGNRSVMGSLKRILGRTENE